MVKGHDLAFTSWLCTGVLRRALARLWGRDVMLYTGGVSFFALLAVFPAVALLVGFYSIMFTTEQAAIQAAALSHLVPGGARGLFTGEMTKLTTTSAGAVSAQSAFALIIGAYAAHRGFKALLAGLTFIHGEEEQHSFVRFNVLAFIVAVAAFALFTVISGVVLAARIVEEASAAVPDGTWLDSEWLWTAIGLTFGLSLVYRYAMSHAAPVIWRAAVIGGVSAAALSLLASWASAVYVEQIAELGATYGSVGAVVVFLIWLSWNVNAIFFGGALATEIEIVLHEYRAAAADDPHPVDETLSLSSPRRMLRR
jgi:membrane protein